MEMTVQKLRLGDLVFILLEDGDISDGSIDIDTVEKGDELVIDDLEYMSKHYRKFMRGRRNPNDKTDTSRDGDDYTPQRG
jgi:hypothetical protein